MARRYHEIKGLAEYTAKNIVSDEQEWKKFLESAGRMYKYPFKEQMLIYAQRPDATACASLELWNEKMNCWVNKGAQGIALIDEEGVHRSGLKYTVLKRCGADTELTDGLELPYIHEFNTVESLTVMGTAASELTEPLLREIGRSINAYDRNRAVETRRERDGEHIEPQRENAEKGLANGSDGRYNALTHESDRQGNESIEGAKESAERSEYGTELAHHSCNRRYSYRGSCDGCTQICSSCWKP